MLIDLSKVDHEKKLSEILSAEVSGSRSVRAVEGDDGTPIGVDEEEEGAETPVLYPDLS